MRRLLAAALVGIGIAALLQRRRRSALPPAEVESSLAEALRQQLAQSRAAEESSATGAAEAAEVAQAAPEETEVDERRRAVHDRARVSIDELGSTNEA